MKLDLQFFAEGEAGAESTPSGMDALNTLLDSADSETEGTDEDNDADTDDSGTDETKPPAAVVPPTDKANAAFAQQRTKLKELTNLLSKIGKAAGIEAADEKELMAKLTDDTIEKLAKKDNVPKELYARLEQLEAVNLQFQAQQREQEVATSVAELKTTYSLSDEQVVNFFKELGDAGLDPFTQQVDITGSYLKLHFNDILKAHTDKQIEAALKKQATTKTESTTPPDKQGGAADTDVKITSVSDLNAFLKGVK